MEVDGLTVEPGMVFAYRYDDGMSKWIPRLHRFHNTSHTMAHWKRLTVYIVHPTQQIPSSKDIVINWQQQAGHVIDIWLEKLGIVLKGEDTAIRSTMLEYVGVHPVEVSNED